MPSLKIKRISIAELNRISGSNVNVKPVAFSIKVSVDD
jgi:hypothetical protein